MGVTSAIVLFIVIWFMTFFVAIPIRVKTQGDLGQVVPGTHAGAPESHHLRKKALYTTAVAFVLWVIISGIILSNWITLEDFDWFYRALPR
ncbi:DUF1467 family protein [Phaeobacter sp. 22II1-1F12B]|uniref:DUF1467 family protein n=1 Tax=Phaeobacter sp. 22II1-1F12B TaxID=1317111 RepID=UPI000B525DB4|nr:DUF1467 family protein [Phaeobacter sp. 22II1-1F12B]OWU76292.1 hypothetical protein ATO1_16675 [Phaeobacter sp. 22II1-1F12B]